MKRPHSEIDNATATLIGGVSLIAMSLGGITAICGPLAALSAHDALGAIGALAIGTLLLIAAWAGLHSIDY